MAKLRVESVQVGVQEYEKLVELLAAAADLTANVSGRSDADAMVYAPVPKFDRLEAAVLAFKKSG
jgi:hypothetical protein